MPKPRRSHGLAASHAACTAPQAGTPEPPTETGGVRRPQTTPRPGVSKPTAAPMADPEETETRTRLRGPVTQSPELDMPLMSSAGGWSQKLPHLTPRCPLSSRHSDAGAESPGSKAGQSCTAPARQPALSDDRTGMGTDQGGRAREAEGGRGPVGVGREAGGGCSRSGL